VKVEVKDKRGSLVVKDSLVAAFFCKRPYPDLAKAFGQVFELWYAKTPDEAKKWALIGAHADEYKAFDPKKVSQVRAEFDPARAKTRNICGVELGGPIQVNSDYHFSFTGVRDLNDRRSNSVEVRFPSREADPDHVEDYVAFVRKIAEVLPYDSGYASLALTYGGQSMQDAFAQSAAKWAFRHPGLDMPDNSATAAGIRQKVRGAYWLTFVGPAPLKELGGSAALRKALPKEIEIEPVGAGVMVRVGTVPEPGDVNKRDKLPRLRALAKVLEPVTQLNDTFLNAMFVDPDEIGRWLRRHLD
jgi:hypothetical protein